MRRTGALYRRLGLQRGESAAVVDAASDAHAVMRLWNAFGAFNGDIDLAFNVFWDVGPALRFLDVPGDVLGRVLEAKSSPPD